MRNADVPKDKIVVTNIPRALIKPYGKKNLNSVVLYACSESESGYASIVVDNKNIKDSDRNPNVVDLLLLKNGKVLRSIKHEGKYVQDYITTRDFARDFENTHSPNQKSRIVEAGRSLAVGELNTGNEPDPTDDY